MVFVQESNLVVKCLMQEEEKAEKFYRLNNHKRLEALRCKKSFKEVFELGSKFVSKSFVLYSLNKDDAVNKVRFGVIASKKVGNAVKRNRAKRLLREISRNYVYSNPLDSKDYILISRYACNKVKFTDLSQELSNAFANLAKNKSKGKN